ncbi:hypothetical protein [Herbaspirillum seropedicae]|uniref:hypothetical protein n=1 Tax=Herbaspirillum seropedicae TaxID=964 RepID=UPI000847E444|nr:hypothetical protein [Herbaspirillum seropedicae]
MKSFPLFWIIIVAFFSFGGAGHQADASALFTNLTVSAMVISSCRVTQDRDVPSLVTSICVNGTDFTPNAQRLQLAQIYGTEQDVTVIF